VTINNKDYPLILHDRIGIQIMEIGEEILNVGFYDFNDDKYNELIKVFT
jgi:hypothetical protein